MAGLTFENYQANAAWGNRWFKYNTSVVANSLQWGVLVLIKDRTALIDGEMKDLGGLIFIGQPTVVDPTPIVFSATSEFISSQYGDDTYSIKPFDGVDSYLERNGYRWYDTGVGGVAYGSDAATYTYNSVGDFYAAVDNNEIRPVEPKVYFDIYINGLNKPSIDVNWTASEDMSPLLCAPRVWIGVEDIIPTDPPIVEYQGYNVPNATGCWSVDYIGQQNYDGSYSTTYLTIQKYFEKFLNPVSRVEHWGFNGDPEYINLYLRMDYDGGSIWGELHRVKIQIDGTPSDTAIQNSGFGNYETIVRFHEGEPDYVLPDDSTEYAGGSNINGDGDGRYNPNDLPDSQYFADNEGRGFDGNAVLTKTYSITASILQNIGQKLWSQDYLDVLKIQNNPIENIISVKAFPFAETGGTQEEVKIGDVAFGVNGYKIPSSKKIHIGSVKYDGSVGNYPATNSYLDISPYTITKLYLPYCGIVQIDASDLYNSTLSVDYAIDFVTGDCVALLELDGIPYMNVSGHMGIDVPLTSSNRIQTELRTAAATLSAVGGSVGQMVSGNVGGGVLSGASSALSIIGTDYNSQRTSDQSPTCTSYENHAVFLIVEKPLETVTNSVGFVEADSAGYKHLHGYPCNKYMSLNQLNGFVAVDRRSDIQIAMTSEENALLEQLLTQGVYI